MSTEISDISTTLVLTAVSIVLSTDLTGPDQDGGEAAGGTVEEAGTLSHVGEQDGLGGVGALLPHPQIVVNAGTPRLI